MDNNERPIWLPKAKEIDFKSVNDPLEESYEKVLKYLETKLDEKLNFYLKHLLSLNFQTYKLIRKLIVEEPSYPIQAHILSRSIIEIEFVISALISNPQDNVGIYEKAGYKKFYETYQNEMKHYEEAEDDYTLNYLKEKKKFFDVFAKDLNLSQDEIDYPSKNLSYWPIPSQMVRSSSSKPLELDKNLVSFLKKVIKWNYKDPSDNVHTSWGGIAMYIYIP